MNAKTIRRLTSINIIKRKIDWRGRIFFFKNSWIKKAAAIAAAVKNNMRIFLRNKIVAAIIKCENNVIEKGCVTEIFSY